MDDQERERGEEAGQPLLTEPEAEEHDASNPLRQLDLADVDEHDLGADALTPDVLTPSDFPDREPAVARETPAMPLLEVTPERLFPLARALFGPITRNGANPNGNANPTGAVADGMTADMMAYQDFVRRLLSMQRPDTQNNIKEDRAELQNLNDLYVGRVLSQAAYALARETSLIESAVYVSSCDDPETQGMNQMLNFDVRPATFWSSAGHQTQDSRETVVFRLKEPTTRLNWVMLKVYRAFYQPGHPIYPSKTVRFAVCNSPQSASFSREFRVLRLSEPQRFDLTTENLGVGQYLVLDLRGMLQTQVGDELYYCVLETVCCGGMVEDYGQVLNSYERQRRRSSRPVLSR
ncbi:F-box protein [Porphyridium purpureum]|uniref:F-box protein n=1 Tax=Porphyridium purpureum TaxID=35688 RepID=A0A5J4YWT2_PORPP|nr:F-box protein [Porphyridium purpureum]|eukprot:POR1634..scf209_3